MLDIQMTIWAVNRAILHRAFTSSGKGALTKATRKGTTFDLRPGVRSPPPAFAQFKDLPLLVPEARVGGARNAPAPIRRDNVQGVNLHVIGLSDGLESPAGPSGWPPGRRRFLT